MIYRVLKEVRGSLLTIYGMNVWSTGNSKGKSIEERPCSRKIKGASMTGAHWERERWSKRLIGGLSWTDIILFYQEECFQCPLFVSKLGNHWLLQIWMKSVFTLIIHNLVVDTTRQRNIIFRCDKNIIKDCCNRYSE